ncbi:ubiquinone biosynthesis protein COQ9, mitochondrial-like [Saccoglossus kowalevskii]|uniref:Ubiquinone biosynthesis protein n=1 Tax=Saccoglossus kowalevskii TaxID=10224 RepID=A0ABM0GIU9_SACKO|nr:PREDICTED: ubiquinone biosynthesis protein COQ9, mitochondrial-like [Saccoglossus kowalevskii]
MACSVTIGKLSLFHLARVGVRSCLVSQIRLMCTTTEGRNNSSNGNSTHEEKEHIYQDHEEEEVEERILRAGLSFVPEYGWTKKSLAEAAILEGYPSVLHGMFPRGGGDLLHYFVRHCNKELVVKLCREAKEREETSEKKNTTEILQDAIETRLRMITPYIDTWPQAMALTALPENITEHFKNLGLLMDDMWFYAGDRSTTFSWYTKRASLAVVYKSAELSLVQDQSFDFEDTWAFLDRRLEDAATFGHFGMMLGEFTRNFGVNVTAAFEISRNMAGLNSRNR